MSLKFSEGTAKLIQEEIQSAITPDQVGFSCNMNNDNLFLIIKDLLYAHKVN